MPGQNIDRTVPPPWASWDVAFMLLRAAGHAAIYGTVVWLVESAKDDNNFDMIGPPAMACAFVVWLLIVGRSSGPSILRLIATGYTTVAPAALMVLFAFGASAESTLRLGVLILPLVLLVTGTAAAVVTVAYGLTLRHGSRLARRKGWFGSSHARDRQALPPRSGEPTADTLTRQSARPSSYQPHDIHPLRSQRLDYSENS